jgi:hypothetical protein
MIVFMRNSQASAPDKPDLTADCGIVADSTGR